MAWNIDESQKRVDTRNYDPDDIEIKPLTREMDFGNLGQKQCRSAFGAHLYADIVHMDQLVGDRTLKKENHKRMIRCLHVLRREQSRIISACDGVKIHFQGPRIHALFHKPYNDAEGIACQALLAAIALQVYVKGVFNKLFPTYKDFHFAVGIDIGESLVANIGGADRELISLGNPANIAAKILGNVSSEIAITSRIYKVLSDDDLIGLFGKSTYKRANQACHLHQYNGTKTLEEVLEAHNIKWSPEKAEKRSQADRDAIPLKNIKMSGAEILIDTDKLSIHACKRVVGATIFADISGFTKCIAEAKNDDEKRELIWIFDMVRRELRDVVCRDLPGVFIQHQGDRIQALFHMPKDDETKIVEKAIWASIGVQSSMEHVLNELFETHHNLHIAVGCSINGDVIVTRLGPRGDRDTVCIGQSVLEAETLEDLASGCEIAINEKAHDFLNENLSEYFPWDEDRGIYLAQNLTIPNLHQEEYQETFNEYQNDKNIYVKSSSKGTEFKTSEELDHATKTEYRSVQKTKPWYNPLV